MQRCKKLLGCVLKRPGKLCSSPNKVEMNQNQRRNQLVQCLKVVILQDNHAIETLREYEKTAGVDIYTTPLAFRVPAEDLPMFESSCDCWFEHEYFDYLENGQCNQNMFVRICSYLDNGQCEHFSEEKSVHDKSAIVYLIHAAVAMNNRKVTKYISRQILKRSRESLDNLTTGSGSLTAAHIAVVKGSKDVLQYVTQMYVDKTVSNDRLQCYLHGIENEDPFSIYKRNESSGKIETIEIGNNSVLMSLLKLYRSPFQLNVLLQLIPVLDKEDLEELMHNHLSKGDEELTLFLLNIGSSMNMCLDSSILLNAIFTHAHNFVKIWIRNKQSLLVEVMGVKIHVQFMANALGCHKCTSMVHRGIKKDQTKQSENDAHESPDISPYIVACNSAERFEYKTDILLSILKDIYYKGSCSLHKRNRSSESVLHVLAQSDFYNNEAMKCLLQLGSDVNACDDNGNTPLHVVVKSSNCSVATVKCLLEHGADINLSNSNGQTSFKELIRKTEQKCSRYYRYFIPGFTSRSEKDLLMECMKYMLYYNPRIDIHPDVLASIENIDCYNYFDGYINLPVVPDPADRSVSLFAMLLELGFVNFKAEELDPDQHDDEFLHYFRLNSVFQHSKRTEFVDYFKQFTSQPRSLQSICRLQIRQAFPGYRLHKLFQLIEIPKSLQEFILCKNVLFYNA